MLAGVPSTPVTQDSGDKRSNAASPDARAIICETEVLIVETALATARGEKREKLSVPLLSMSKSDK
jgi:hypothetical protein